MWAMNYLIILTGLIGTGKSGVSIRLGNRLNAEIISADNLRGYSNNLSFDKNNYQAEGDVLEKKEQTYEKIFRKAREELDKGRCVILDATFSRKDWRDYAKKVAREKRTPYYLIEVICSNENVLRLRLGRRSKRNRAAAPYDVHMGQREKFEKVEEGERNFTIDTAPIPKDPNVELVTMPEGYFAVNKYSGRSTDKRFIKYKEILKEKLIKDKIEIKSIAIKATYNGPFTLPSLRRNEAMFKILWK